MRPLAQRGCLHGGFRFVGGPAVGGSRFAAMGLVDDELERLDVHEAFLRRVG